LQTSLEDSRLFARLSGDFNPLHVDPLAARRLMFGSTVVHGIDILLRLIETALRETGGGALTALKASFGSPLLTGVDATIEAADEPGQAEGALSYKAVSQGRVIQRVTLTMAGGQSWPPAPNAAPFAPALPHERDFAALSAASGSVPLGFDPEIAHRLYPGLARSLPPLQLAVLLATTRIVGMECPGLHSVYTELNLAFDPARANDAAALSFRVTKADPRFKLLTIAIDGGGASGQITALVRPAPAAQPSFAQVRARVQRTLPDCRAIVIGGSRGLGEITAKILAAAGADLMVTYAAGSDDAARVADEIRAGGGRCGAFRLDVTSPPAERPGDLPAGWAPTEIYYFASPHIEIRPGEPWNAGLFARFCDFYVTGLARSLAAIDAWSGVAQPLKLFYPSSVFLDEPVRGAAEYAAAKAAGEQLCRNLSVTRRGLTAECPRLPRMLTDQTSGLKASQTQAPLDVMLGILLPGSER
jgi:NADP-dependent 3-hydroxy acid dehydrogenase YdfG